MERLEREAALLLVQARVTDLRDGDGKEYEFLASNETLQDIKIGDPIKVKLQFEGLDMMVLPIRVFSSSKPQ